VAEGETQWRVDSPITNERRWVIGPLVFDDAVHHIDGEIAEAIAALDKDWWLKGLAVAARPGMAK
jgi:hypothetical protein